MKLHPRSRITAFAHNELDRAVIDIITKHQLTYGELFGILAQIQASWAKWQIKDERKEAGK